MRGLHGARLRLDLPLAALPGDGAPPPGDRSLSGRESTASALRDGVGAALKRHAARPPSFERMKAENIHTPPSSSAQPAALQAQLPFPRRSRPALPEEGQGAFRAEAVPRRRCPRWVAEESTGASRPEAGIAGGFRDLCPEAGRLSSADPAWSRLRAQRRPCRPGAEKRIWTPAPCTGRAAGDASGAAGPALSGERLETFKAEAVPRRRRPRRAAGEPTGASRPEAGIAGGSRDLRSEAGRPLQRRSCRRAGPGPAMTVEKERGGHHEHED